MITSEEWKKLKVGDVVWWKLHKSNKIIKLKIDKFWENRSFLTAISENGEMFSIGTDSERCSINKFKLEQENGN